MKYSIAVLFSLLLWGTVSAQKIVPDADKVYFYGADFSAVRIIGAAEDNDSFVRAFIGINGLFVYQSAKYDFSRVTGCPVEVDIAMMSKRTRQMDTSHMRESQLSTVKAEDLIKDYDLSQESGTGLVLVARQLDKTAKRGTYDFVFFDIATRRVIVEKSATKEAGGGNLRNYWIRPVLEMIQDKKLFAK